MEVREEGYYVLDWKIINIISYTYENAAMNPISVYN